jgi:hypothetical protein
VVRGNTIHFFGLLGYAAKEVASTHDDGDLDPQRVDVGQFGSDGMYVSRVNAETLTCGQCFSGELQQHAFEDRSRHNQFSVFRF